MAARNVINPILRPESKAALERLTRWTQIKQTDIVGRIFALFFAMPEAVQREQLFAYDAAAEPGSRIKDPGERTPMSVRPETFKLIKEIAARTMAKQTYAAGRILTLFLSRPFDEQVKAVSGGAVPPAATDATPLVVSKLKRTLSDKRGSPRPPRGGSARAGDG